MGMPQPYRHGRSERKLRNAGPRADRPTRIRHWLNISDLHVGSTRAIVPPGFVTLEGQTIQHNAAQEWLWAGWQRMLDWARDLIGDHPFGLTINGDCVEGVHHGTKQVWSPDTSDHVSAAIQLLRPIAEDADAVFMVRGTECHTGSSAEVVIGAALGAREVGGQFAVDVLNLSIHGVPCRWVHHIGTSTRLGLYATQLSMMLAEAQAQAVRFGQTVPRVYCAGHRHTFGVYQDDKAACVTLPPWQLLTRFGYKVAPAAVVGVGAVIYDWEHSEHGDLPRIHSFVHRPQPEQEISL